MAAGYLILRYNLKDGVTPDRFEQWVRETDYPKMRGLARVERFQTYRVTGRLIGEGAPSQDYFELFEISDFDGFREEDLNGDVVRAVMGEFATLVRDAEFNIVEPVE
jgi:hypothetical protein